MTISFLDYSDLLKLGGEILIILIQPNLDHSDLLKLGGKYYNPFSAQSGLCWSTSLPWRCWEPRCPNLQVRKMLMTIIMMLMMATMMMIITPDQHSASASAISLRFLRRSQQFLLKTPNTVVSQWSLWIATIAIQCNWKQLTQVTSLQNFWEVREGVR